MEETISVAMKRGDKVRILRRASSNTSGLQYDQCGNMKRRVDPDYGVGVVGIFHSYANHAVWPVTPEMHITVRSINNVHGYGAFPRADLELVA